MKQSKLILALILSVLFALTLLPLTAGAAVKIAPPKQTQYVDIGGKAQLAITVSGGKKASSLPITYVSDNPAVATVDETGLLTGVAKGIANMTVTYDTQTLKVPVYVCEDFHTYTDKKNYQMSVPASWPTVGDSGDSTDIFCDFRTANNDANGIVMMQKIDANITNAQFAADREAQNKENGADFQMLCSEKTPFAGRDGWTMVYTFINYKSKAYKEQMSFTIKNKVLYYFAFTAPTNVFDQYAIENKRMLESLKLLK